MPFQSPAVWFDAEVIDENPFIIFAEARNGNQGALATCTRQPHFKVTGNTVSDETADVINLSDQGVPFPENTLRRLDVRAYLRGNAADDGCLEYAVLIEGGANTPDVIESALDVDLDTELPSATAELSFHVTGDEVVVRATGTPSGTGGPANWEVEVFVHPVADISQASS